MLSKLRSALMWILGEARERFDVRGTIRELRELGRKYGKRFLVAAAIWECIESIVLPAVALYYRQPVLAAMFVIFHAEPVVYPFLFFAFRTYDRLRSRLPWEPDRSAMSASYRSGAKVTLYRAGTVALYLGLFSWATIGQVVLAVYTVLMLLFHYVHERLWHDTSYGITEDDRVRPARVLFKAVTYRAVSALVMAGAFKAMLPAVPWAMIGVYQGAALVLYLGLEALWARTAWGIQTVARPASSPIPAAS